MTARALRVLVVDDEPGFLQSVSRWLASRGHYVLPAQDGDIALGFIQHDQPDVVFLDMEMPRVDGVEVLRRLRAISRTLPVILVSVLPTEGPRFTEAQTLGIAGIFPKTGTAADLHAVIEEALSGLAGPVGGARAAGGWLRRAFGKGAGPRG
jgi:CheY-like chemotaxis protein